MLRTLLAAMRRIIFPLGRNSEPSATANGNTSQPGRVAGGSPLSRGQPYAESPIMNAAFEKLTQHMDERNVRYLTGSDNRSICADFRGEVGTYRVIATVDTDDSLFQVLGCSPVRVPVGGRPSVAETIARANYGLKMGKLEMDVDDGELRFQVSQLLTEDALDDMVIDRLMGLTMAMLDRYLPAVLSVIYGNELPKDAIRCVEPRPLGSGEAEGSEQDADH